MKLETTSRVALLCAFILGITFSVHSQIRLDLISSSTEMPMFTDNSLDILNAMSLSIYTDKKDDKRDYLLTMSIQGNNIRIENNYQFRNKSFSFNSAPTKLFLSGDLMEYFELENLEFYGYSREEYELNGLPPGSYELCFSLMNITSDSRMPIEDQGCNTFWVTKQLPPTILFPPDNSLVEFNNRKKINWLPNHTSFMPVKYEVFIFEKLEGIEDKQLFNYSRPIVSFESYTEEVFESNVYSSLVPKKEYVMFVKVRSLVNDIKFMNGGFSEPHTFRIARTVSKTVLRNNQPLNCDLPVATVIVNEVAGAGQGEYVELLVVGTDAQGTTVNLDGFIVDDNNIDDFDVGNESGHIRLGSCFSAVERGTLILIYDDQASSYSSSDPNVIVVPFSDDCIIKNAYCPQNKTGDTGYNCSGGYAEDWGELIPLRNTHDVIQVRTQSGELEHAITWTSSYEYSGTYKALNVGNNASFTKGIDWYDPDNYESFANTPGAANSLENQALIDQLRGMINGNGFSIDCSYAVVSSAVVTININDNSGGGLYRIYMDDVLVRTTPLTTVLISDVSEGYHSFRVEHSYYKCEDVCDLIIEMDCTVGAPCDDFNPCTGPDLIDENCECIGDALVDISFTEEEIYTQLCDYCFDDFVFASALPGPPSHFYIHSFAAIDEDGNDITIDNSTPGFNFPYWYRHTPSAYLPDPYFMRDIGIWLEVNGYAGYYDFYDGPLFEDCFHGRNMVINNSSIEFVSMNIETHMGDTVDEPFLQSGCEDTDVLLGTEVTLVTDCFENSDVVWSDGTIGEVLFVDAGATGCYEVDFVCEGINGDVDENGDPIGACALTGTWGDDCDCTVGEECGNEPQVFECWVSDGVAQVITVSADCEADPTVGIIEIDHDWVELCSTTGGLTVLIELEDENGNIIYTNTYTYTPGDTFDDVEIQEEGSYVLRISNICSLFTEVCEHSFDFDCSGLDCVLESYYNDDCECVVINDIDSDGDGICDEDDEHPGCDDAGPDSDGDGVLDGCDICEGQDDEAYLASLEDGDPSTDLVCECPELEVTITSSQFSDCDYCLDLTLPLVTNNIDDIVAQRPLANNGWNNEFNVGGTAIAADGFLKFTVTDVGGDTAYQVIGLNDDPHTNAKYTSINYGIYFYYNHTLARNWFRVYDNGSLKSWIKESPLGSEFQIERVGTQVVFKRDGVVFYTSGTASTGDLYFDNSFHSQQSFNGSFAISDISINNILSELETFNELTLVGHDGAQQISKTITGDWLRAQLGAVTESEINSWLSELNEEGAATYYATGNTYCDLSDESILVENCSMVLASVGITDGTAGVYESYFFVSPNCNGNNPGLNYELTAAIEGCANPQYIWSNGDVGPVATIATMASYEATVTVTCSPEDCEYIGTYLIPGDCELNDECHFECIDGTYVQGYLDENCNCVLDEDEQYDDDYDGIVNCLDPCDDLLDSDADGIADCDDPCPDNPDHSDLNEDGIPDCEQCDCEEEPEINYTENYRTVHSFCNAWNPNANLTIIDVSVTDLWTSFTPISLSTEYPADFDFPYSSTEGGSPNPNALFNDLFSWALANGYFLEILQSRVDSDPDDDVDDSFTCNSSYEKSVLITDTSGKISELKLILINGPMAYTETEEELLAGYTVTGVEIGDCAVCDEYYLTWSDGSYGELPSEPELSAGQCYTVTVTCGQSPALRVDPLIPESEECIYELDMGVPCDCQIGMPCILSGGCNEHAIEGILSAGENCPCIALPNNNSDSDGDGVIDPCDMCEGFDDNIDTDYDGYPNGCDLCEGVDDNLFYDVLPGPDGILYTSDDVLNTANDPLPEDCETCEYEEVYDSWSSRIELKSSFCPGEITITGLVVNIPHYGAHTIENGNYEGPHLNFDYCYEGSGSCASGCYYIDDILADRPLANNGYNNQYNVGGAPLTGDGELDFTISTISGQNSNQIIGLNDDPHTNDGFNDIDHGIFIVIRTDRHYYRIIENNTYPQGTNWIQTDFTDAEITIERVGSSVNYLKDGVLLYSSANAGTGDLYFDNSFHSSTAPVWDSTFGISDISVCNSGSNTVSNTPVLDLEQNLEAWLSAYNFGGSVFIIEDNDCINIGILDSQVEFTDLIYTCDGVTFHTIPFVRVSNEVAGFQGGPCDDGDQVIPLSSTLPPAYIELATIWDVYNEDCECEGFVIDSDGDGEPDSEDECDNWPDYLGCDCIEDPTSGDCVAVVNCPGGPMDACEYFANVMSATTGPNNNIPVVVRSDQAVGPVKAIMHSAYYIQCVIEEFLEGASTIDETDYYLDKTDSDGDGIYDMLDICPTNGDVPDSDGYYDANNMDCCMLTPEGAQLLYYYQFQVVQQYIFVPETNDPCYDPDEEEINIILGCNPPDPIGDIIPACKDCIAGLTVYEDEYCVLRDAANNCPVEFGLDCDGQCYAIYPIGEGGNDGDCNTIEPPDLGCTTVCDTEPCQTAYVDEDCNCVFSAISDEDNDGLCDIDDPCSDPESDPDGDGNFDSGTDSDGDGTADACDSCPNADGSQGDECDDGDPCTFGDELKLINGACTCAGQLVDLDDDGTYDCLPCEEEDEDCDCEDEDGDCYPCCEPCANALDNDGDGYIDQILPNDSDGLDADGNYVTSPSCDLCPGLDDSIDTDGNGIPDCLDPPYVDIGCPTSLTPVFGEGVMLTFSSDDIEENQLPEPITLSTVSSANGTSNIENEAYLLIDYVREVDGMFEVFYANSDIAAAYDYMSVSYSEHQPCIMTGNGENPSDLNCPTSIVAEGNTISMDFMVDDGYSFDIAGITGSFDFSGLTGLAGTLPVTVDDAQVSVNDPQNGINMDNINITVTLPGAGAAGQEPSGSILLPNGLTCPISNGTTPPGPCPDGANEGDPCDDGDAGTHHDKYDSSCNCAGELGPDADGDGVTDEFDQCDDVPNGPDGECPCPGDETPMSDLLTPNGLVNGSDFEIGLDMDFADQFDGLDIVITGGPETISLTDIEYSDPLVIPNLPFGYTYSIEITGGCSTGGTSTADPIVVDNPYGEDQFVCGTNFEEVDLSNYILLASLSSGDTFEAADFTVNVRSATGSYGTFSGKGYVEIPYFNFVRINVRWENIVISEGQTMISGFVEITGLGLAILGDPLTDQINDAINEIINVLDDIDEILDEVTEILDAVEELVATTGTFVDPSTLECIETQTSILEVLTNQEPPDEEAIKSATELLQLCIDQYNEDLEQILDNILEFTKKSVDEYIPEYCEGNPQFYTDYDNIKNVPLTDFQTSLTNLLSQIGQGGAGISSLNSIYSQSYQNEENTDIVDPTIISALQNYYEIEGNNDMCRAMEKLNEYVESNELTIEQVKNLLLLFMNINIDLAEQLGDALNVEDPDYQKIYNDNSDLIHDAYILSIRHLMYK